MKFINFVVAAVFFIFAAVQFNDPDPFVWALMYAFVGGVALFKGLGKENRLVLLGGLAAVLIWMGFLVPEFSNWLKMGMPSITESMKAEEPYIEFAREFLGLFLCGITLTFYLILNYRKAPDNAVVPS